MAKSVFEQIKKQNGERFAKAIRGFDNGIFDIPGIVDIVKYAGHDAEPIMGYLESLKKVHVEETGVYQDPITLLDAAGYDAYYVTNLEEQNAIQKYYAPAEKLCTFRDPTRFQRYHIINAVKKNVDQIRRKDFRGKEQREDEYGTSVISIQILKTGGFISIKNRYNHTVENPDNTFFSNPDRIIPGLAGSLKHHFNTDFSAQEARLPGGYTMVNNQIIHYNYEQDNIYFGSDFYVKDGQIHHLKDHEIMLDTFIFDMRTKELTYPGSPAGQKPSSEEDLELKKVLLQEIGDHKVIFKKDKEGHHLFIRKEGEKDPAKDVEILTVKDGAITALNLPTTTEIGINFLSKTNLRSFNAPLLTTMEGGCLYSANSLEQVSVPSLKTMGKHCFRLTRRLESFEAPELRTIGEGCFYYASALKKINTPALIALPECCFVRVNALESATFPNVAQIDDYCLAEAESLKTLILPKLTLTTGSTFCNESYLKTFYAPLLEEKPRDFCEYMNPIKRMILWMKRKQPPKDLPVAETGISAALRATESTKTGDPKGIS
ncbi:MAG: leucine-rich repeat protein, partial [Alphaproteobacteria bacterium]|nr:leucine-rich repeat protein [Alphaproteobacteria bacterium]